MDIRLSRPALTTDSFYSRMPFRKAGRHGQVVRYLKGVGAKGLKCSVKLGVARFELEDRSVMIYSSGRVDIRKILNTDEARAVMEKITDLVKEALSDISS